MICHFGEYTYTAGQLLGTQLGKHFIVVSWASKMPKIDLVSKDTTMGRKRETRSIEARYAGTNANRCAVVYINIRARI